MSKIKKLKIKGLRSFDPNEKSEPQVIEFSTPLTLIKGQNGCGKTTIIEALKYALTGEYPPNSARGQTFINDPKLSNVLKSKAAVELELHDTKNEVVTVKRNLEINVIPIGKTENITLKSSGSSVQRTTSAVIEVLNEESGQNEVTNVVENFPDTKEEICQLIGVPQSILNDVVFCHQEDSCWPLDESSTVKEKFDSIFNTEDYIKCLEYLNKVEKDMKRLALYHKAGLTYALETVTLSRQKKTDLEGLEEKLKTVLEEHGTQEGELNTQETKLKELEALEKTYIDLSNKVVFTKLRIENGEKAVEELKGTIKEPFEGDLASLNEFYENFSSDLKEKKNNLNIVQKELIDLTNELRHLHSSNEKFLIEEGKFIEKETINKERRVNYKMLIGEIVPIIRRLAEKEESPEDPAFVSFIESHDKSGDNIDLIDSKLVKKVLVMATRSKMSEMNNFKISMDVADKEWIQKIDEWREKKISAEKEIELKEKLISDNKKKIDEFHKRIISIESSNETINYLIGDEQQASERIDSIEKSGIIVKFENEIQTYAEECKELEEKINAIADDVDILNDDKHKVDQISIYSRQIIDKQKECLEITKKWEDSLKIIFPTDVPPTDDIATILKEKCKEMRKDLNDMQMDLKKKELEHGRVEYSYNQKKVEVEKKESEMENLRTQLRESLDGRDFDSFYQEITEKLTKTEKDNYYSDALQFQCNKYIQKMKAKNGCPLCKRDFESPEFLQILEEKLLKKIEKKMGNKEEDLIMIEKLRDIHASLSELKPSWDQDRNHHQLVIPKLKEEKIELEKRTSELIREVEELTAKIAITKKEFTLIVELSNAYTLYDSYMKDVRKFQGLLEKIEGLRNPKANECSMNFLVAQTELLDLKANLHAKKTLKENKEEMLARNREILDKFRQKKLEVLEEKARISLEMQNRDSLLEQKKGLEEENKEMESQIEALTLSIPNFKIGILDTEKQRTASGIEKDKELATIRTEKELIERHKIRLNELQHQIADFEEAKTKFNVSQQKYTECKETIEKGETKKKELTEYIEIQRTEIGLQDMKERDLLDNQVYKRKEEEVMKLRSDLLEQEQNLANANEGAAGERAALATIVKGLTAKLAEVQSLRRETESSVNTLKRDLSKKPYSSAEEDYMEKLVRKTVHEMAVKEVANYKEALDDSIVAYHEQKMTIINERVKELWKCIYKGSDIDYIEIKTGGPDQDKMNGTPYKSTVKKSYSYRVVMKRGDVELDMRNRCSAGQKILASLIIRIAIAEAFNTKCGIIALDEPTSSLDMKNSRALADTLADISVKMQDSKTFQLVVITHDEDFIDRLLHVDRVDHFYEITRDSRGCSKILRKTRNAE